MSRFDGQTTNDLEIQWTPECAMVRDMKLAMQTELTEHHGQNPDDVPHVQSSSSLGNVVIFGVIAVLELFVVSWYG